MYSKSMGVTVWLEQFGVLNIWTYLAGMFFIIIVPGPNSLYVLKTSASIGVGAGYRAALGVFIGDAILIFLAFIGVASVIKASPVLFTIVRFLGAFYLLYLGIKIIHANFFAKKQSHTETNCIQEYVFRKALTLSLTNPKAILFYISFFVQFIDFNYAHTGLSYLILASMLEAFSFVYLSFLIFGGVALARFFGSRKNIAKLGNGIVGLFFMGFATKLATLSS
ncbi:leucine efflux protein LeuE [Proteus mirabilis]|uniref:leucine efflux protein LeuE n=1 Tax=Proteus mirabilis TaxID=584 RepID=UPI000D526403|nr:leucine efflux protein LeuE [Proteus mirabilis]AWF41699.1 leucine efflux protein [Proteus mirabilis]HBC7455173.1 leucine efflux protein LeuE [Proteus mirabilis]HCT7979683.1 leucine efflux protein LeuE [Proteus mirabilis]HDU8703382.1 leucine efflux protein LeuE [Proteus mirabilis]HEI8494371.1 leucine efflux protein LeuE [Proteus mirabilis]